MALISIIVPCHNEEETLPLFYRAVTEAVSGLSGDAFEFIFIDDGSGDGTLVILRELHQRDPRVKYISFSRNFGKEAGILAGLKKSAGDYIVIMDADLQHPPEYIPRMLDSIKTGGYDIAGMRRIDRRGEGLMRSYFSRRFYKLVRRFSKIDLVDGATDYQMMTRQVAEAVLSLSEYNRFTKGILSWVGFNVKWIPYENVERAAGTTKWTFWGLVRYSLDGITGFSTAPLAISSLLGILICAVAFVMICVIVIKTLIWGDPVAGFPTLACLILLMGGLQLLCIGVLGQYLSKTYLETKKRPVYIIKETENPK